MQRDRITDDIYVFTSDRYAQVTAGVVLTSAGAVVVDTLAYPDESRSIRRFVNERLNTEVRYVVNTHFHADHTTGTCFFEGGTVIAHQRCRELLARRGKDSLEQARQAFSEMRDVELRLPEIVFGATLTLHVGNKTLHFWSTPGHSPDSICCFVEEDQVLFGADTVLPIPHFVDGSYDDLLKSLQDLQNLNCESIVQGHGDVVLRGEIQEKIESDIHYLQTLHAHVVRAVESDSPQVMLEGIDIEACGKSRVLLNGMVQQLHRQNIMTLADQHRERASVQ